ncbi:MAG: hypothetical protein LW817_07290 [Candidatus Caenarcaniphilales bacterium]|nr:hypothetical protein [Candidatus Caenarcaniphilales bacterium]
MSSNPDFNSFKDADLTGFDQLWQVSFKETQNFIRQKSSLSKEQFDKEISLLQKELDDKDFEVQKLNWQLSEREKELRLLYEEMHRLSDINKKLSKQLGDYENLAEKQEELISMLDTDGAIKLEPVLPKFDKKQI